jgi:hypothetical protein
MEGEFIIGAKLDGQSVTLEPGGQFELSGACVSSASAGQQPAPRALSCALPGGPAPGAPVETLHMTCAEVNSHLYQASQGSRAAARACVRAVCGRAPDARSPRAAQVKTLAEEIGVAFLGLGFQPKWSVADTPAMPKARARAGCALAREWSTFQATACRRNDGGPASHSRRMRVAACAAGAVQDHARVHAQSRKHGAGHDVPDVHSAGARAAACCARAGRMMQCMR